MDPKSVPHCPLPFEEAEIHISGDVYTVAQIGIIDIQ